MQHKINKIWLTEEGNLWFQLWVPQLRTKRKYLFIEQAEKNPAFIDHKPKVQSQDRQFLALLRNKLLQGKLEGIWKGKNQMEEDVYEPIFFYEFLAGGKLFYLYYSKSNGFDLIDFERRLSLCRFREGAEYTKHRDFRPQSPRDNVSIFEKMPIDWDEADAGGTEQRPSQEAAPAMDLEPGFARIKAKLKSRIARRIKTLKKSLIRLEDRQVKDERFLELQTLVQDKINDPQFFQKKDFHLELNQLYEELKKVKRSQKKKADVLTRTLRDLEALELDKAEAEKAQDKDQMRSLLDRYHIEWSTQQQTPSPSPVDLPVRSFENETAKIFVSKSAKSGDALIRRMPGNAHWFHIVGTAGPHVIVRFKKKDLTQRAEEDIFRHAMIFALHYSKQGKDFSGEVYQSVRSELRKQKGLVDGLWLIRSAKTHFIRYSKQELDEVFARY